MTAEEIKTLKWWFDNKGPIYYFNPNKEGLPCRVISIDEANEVAHFHNCNSAFYLGHHSCFLIDFGQISIFG